eukprot:9198692-Alexandrium_andersonii.AAC.1
MAKPMQCQVLSTTCDPALPGGTEGTCCLTAADLAGRWARGGFLGSGTWGGRAGGRNVEFQAWPRLH